MSVELMTENFLQMTQSKSRRCEETFSVHRVNKNKPTSGFLKHGIISNMRRKLSKEPERKDRPRTEGKWKCQALESGPQSKRSNARSSESKQLATGSHAPREALQGNRTLRQAHDTLKSQGRTKLEDAGKMLNGVSGKRTTIFSNRRL